MPPQREKPSKACVICHKKKIKCDLAAANQPCTNCRNGDYICRFVVTLAGGEATNPHQRKRKQYSISPGTPSRAHVEESQSQNSPIGASHASITSFEASPPIYRVTEDENSAAAAALGLQHLRNNNPSIPTLQTLLVPSSPQEGPGPPTEQSYVGRSDYLGGHQVPFSEEVDVPSRASSPHAGLADIDLRILQLKRSFDLPSRTIRASLIDAFMAWCLPWMPILERRWLDEPKPSLLLLQSVFLAGSRVLSNPFKHASSSNDYYDRAKTLFFHGHERNTLISIVAVCLLQWWNPTGPEKISTSTSGFWVRIGVGLAYQVGLHMEPADGVLKRFRRRLWWTLVCRDCIISVGVGRPRAINLEDATVKPPSVDDFPVVTFHARLFVAYVSICKQMGDIAEAHRRRTLTLLCQQRFENALYRWLKELPLLLRLFHGDERTRALAPYSFESRQLAVPYFVSLIILNRRSNGSAIVPTTCLVASSFVIGIYEDFIARDQLRYLGPVFAFYALAAGLVQLTAYRYDATRTIAAHSSDIVCIALEQLSQRWGSAHGALKSFSKAREAILRQPMIEQQPSPLPVEAAIFFEDFGPELCPLWHLSGLEIRAPSNQYSGAASADSGDLNVVWDNQRSGAVSDTSFMDSQAMGSLSSTLGPEAASAGFDEIQLFDEFQVPMASWLLEDYETLGF